MATTKNSLRYFGNLAACLLLAGSLAPCLLARRVDAQAVLTGRVTDTAGVPILGARISLSSTPLETRTDERGNFTLAGVPMGETTVSARRLGFAPSTVPLQVSEESGARVSIRMTPVAAFLPAVVVRPTGMTYTGRLAGYYSRLEKKTSGYFITREQIDRENPSTTGQLLQSVPGIQAYAVRAGTGGIRMRDRNCWPLVWMDGTPMPSGEVDIDAFVPSSIQGIELYLGSTTAPVRYIANGNRSSCGTILIWSRGPDTDPVSQGRSAASDLEELIARQSAYSADDVDRTAQLDTTHALNLAFPPALFASGTPGLVIAQFVVDTAGRVEGGTVDIASSTGPLFSDAVRAALLTAYFLPAEKKGHLVRQVVQLPFEFHVGDHVAQHR